jgi:ketosteroid isomerase-like protein
VIADAQQLEPTLIRRQHSGDLDGMVALYERGAVLIDEDGLEIVGQGAIRDRFAADLSANRTYEAGRQQRPVVCGDLALTSTRLSDGTVTAEVARRQKDGGWLWVIDRFSIAHESPPSDG